MCVSISIKIGKKGERSKGRTRPNGCEVMAYRERGGGPIKTKSCRRREMGMSGEVGLVEESEERRIVCFCTRRPKMTSASKVCVPASCMAALLFTVALV